MENDIRKRRINTLTGHSELNKDKEVVRTKLVMSLASLLKEIRLLPILQAKVIEGYFEDLLEEANLTKKEQDLFDFEFRETEI